MTHDQLPSVLLVGCGNMGHALLKGWLKHGLKPSIILDRHTHDLPAPHQLVETIDQIPTNFKPDIIVLAVKPQKSDSILHLLGQHFPNALLLSVMAGRTVLSILEAFKKESPSARPVIFRSMPNTPCAFEEGVTGLYAPPGATDTQKQNCDKLLKAVGQTVWVDQENQINVVAAISGSGPAYALLLAELLEHEAIRHGLSAETARIVARGTISGAGALLKHSHEDAQTLRKNITSPGGTTQAALSVFMLPSAWPQSVERAVCAAIQRAQELAS